VFAFLTVIFTLSVGIEENESFLFSLKGRFSTIAALLVHTKNRVEIIPIIRPKRGKFIPEGIFRKR